MNSARDHPSFRSATAVNPQECSPLPSSSTCETLLLPPPLQLDYESQPASHSLVAFDRPATGEWLYNARSEAVDVHQYVLGPHHPTRVQKQQGTHYISCKSRVRADRASSLKLHAHTHLSKARLARSSASPTMLFLPPQMTYPLRVWTQDSISRTHLHPGEGCVLPRSTEQ